MPLLEPKAFAKQVMLMDSDDSEYAFVPDWISVGDSDVLIDPLQGNIRQSQQFKDSLVYYFRINLYLFDSFYNLKLPREQVLVFDFRLLIKGICD